MQLPSHIGWYSLCILCIVNCFYRGVFDRNKEANTFKSYTIVNVLYCSGDIHGGNVVRDYVDSNGEPVTQKGLANAQAALDWVANQQHNGNLTAELSSLVSVVSFKFIVICC